MVRRKRLKLRLPGIKDNTVQNLKQDLELGGQDLELGGQDLELGGQDLNLGGQALELGGHDL